MTTRSTSRLVALVALAGALALGGRDLDARPKRKGKPMTYDEAIALLGKPARWCDGAAALGKLGDKRAIGPLFAVVALAGEGLPDRDCVRDALVKLDVRAEAMAMIGSADDAVRKTAIGMLKAFPADADGPVLAKVAIGDPDLALRVLAVRALRTHKATAAYDAGMIAILDAPDAEVRAIAAGSLERRFGADVLAALKARRAVEHDALVTDALAAAIKRHEDHAAHR